MIDSMVLPILILLTAVLYSSVGHAGASGYLAVMALVGLPPDQMKPSALLLNILVASIGSYRYNRTGLVRKDLLVPLLIGSIPTAFLGGALSLPGASYKRIVGVILLLATARLWRSGDQGRPNRDADEIRAPRTRWILTVLIGAAIGMLSGITGTGGGVFLTPLLLFLGWAVAKEAASVSIVFILLNSLSGLLGYLAKSPSLHPSILSWLAAAIVGGLIGTELGASRLDGRTMQKLLCVVLILAALKLLLT